MAQSFITLSELQARIKQGIDQAHPLPYWVGAEVSELKVNYSGHCYLELVEKGGENHVPKSKVSAVMWRTTYQMVAPYFQEATGQKLAAGLKVLIKVVVSYHELYGLSLQVTDIDPTYTLGDMERQRQETIQRLQQDGIYEMNRELEFPLVVQRLAVVSSRNAAGYQDFMQELGSSVYAFRVTLFDAFMQGDQAEVSVVAALDEVAERVDEFDAVVVIRGGGSQSDLGCFNSYRLCSHIAQFPLPVITGIGHDKDQSVADLVAAASLKTPTAVAVFLKNEMAEVDGRLDGLMEEFRDASLTLLDEEQRRLRSVGISLKEISTGMVHGMNLRLERLSAELKRNAGMMIQQRHSALELLQARLSPQGARIVQEQSRHLKQLLVQIRQRATDMLQTRKTELGFLADLTATRDPQRIIDMGFAVVQSQGKTLSESSSLRPGDEIEIVMRKGRTITANVQKVK